MISGHRASAERAAPIQYDSRKLVLIVDLAGTFLFGIEGATAAIRGDLDLLGVLVLAFSTALAGGYHSRSPDRRYSAGLAWRLALRGHCLCGRDCGLVLYRFVHGIFPNLIMVLDAAGLSLFAVAGTEKALEHKMHPFIAVLLGTITGVGGGTIRDMFLAKVPTVLRADVYATAALAGAALLIAARRLGLAPRLSATLGGALCFTLRVVSVYLHWNLPRFAAH